ncbi:MAG: hypothetical protein EXQ85_06910 [Alphaproteobacteria bacterium]|nr:hypothetical protein [Alphaproteobacteria bacterium]
MGGLALAAAMMIAATPGAAQPTDLLRVAVPQLTPGFARPDQGTSSPSSDLLSPLYNSLTVVRANGTVEESLATEWKNVDKTTWHLKLRPNVKFHMARR